jgi:hypothetical protein
MTNKKYLALILVIMMLGIQQVSAQDLQGLSWGLYVGDQLEYMWTHTTHNENTSEMSTYTGNVTLEITDLGALSSSHFSWMGDINHADVVFTNGTSVPMTIGWSAVPIGNWTLMEELLTIYSQSSTPDRLDFSLTETNWNVEIDTFFEETGGVSNVTRSYSRQDGALTYEYSYLKDYPNVGWLQTNELTRINPPTSPATPLSNSMILIIAGAGIGILVLVIVFHKLRGR